MLILGIESSCDETAAAVLADGATLLSDVVYSQIDTHRRYGGVVPELASRQHLETIYQVTEQALTQAGVTLAQIEGLAVTSGPGLIGSLLVGLSFAKALAFVTGIPLIGVDHLAGHLLSVFFAEQGPEFPYVALVVSGGHSSIFAVDGPLAFRLLGRTRDDAAGEAFDKVAKLLNLGYPGGPAISAAATGGDPGAIPLPRAWLAPESLDFSFSGLKTAVVNHVNRQGREGAGPLNIADICASFQEAVAEVLVEKAILAARRTGINRIVMAGGVASNERLRERLRQRGRAEGCEVFIPPPHFCTDNAAMIALAGWHKLRAGVAASYDLDVYSRTDYGKTNV